MTTRILLIGGHGKVALLAEPLLVEAGHHVTAVIRNPDHEADVQATGATPLVADVQSFDDEQMRNLVSGNDVVVWSAGAGGGQDAEEPSDTAARGFVLMCGPRPPSHIEQAQTSLVEHASG